MKPTEIKGILTSFKATGGKLILKVRQNMHFIQRQKDEAVYTKASYRDWETDRKSVV